MFKGTTLRSMLLNAYGWWKVSHPVIAAIVAFALGGLALIGSVFGFVADARPGRRPLRQSRPTERSRPRSHNNNAVERDTLRPRRKARAGKISRPSPAA